MKNASNGLCFIQISLLSNHRIMIPEMNQALNQSIIREYPGPRVTQEQIIIENEQTSSTIQSVVCPVCLCVLSLPHWSCDKCDNVFCKDCMQNWWKKNEKTCIFKCQDAQFKMIKRSNTYNALMQILKVRCKSCESAVSISSITSHDKICPKKLVQCTIQGCKQIIFRCELQEHIKNCQFRKQQCRYCGQMFLVAVIQPHSKNQCAERIIRCQNQGCQASLKVNLFAQHQQTCQFLKIKCQWCQTVVIKKEIQLHISECPLRQFECQWCNQKFKNNLYKEHEGKCLQSRVNCALCRQSVKQTLYNNHKQQCMFTQMIKYKQSQQELIVQNTKLKQKIHQLELILDQMSRTRHQSTLKSLIQLKEEEKKELQRDLLRIKNSMQSIRKLRNEQFNEHQKKFHLSTSLCVICNTIRKKLEDQIEPLVKMQEQTVSKIKQIERMENAARRSAIREC